MVGVTLPRWEGAAVAAMVAALLLIEAASGFSQGPEACRRLCPDSRELPYGGCYVAQAVVDPVTSMCYRCGAASFNETVSCAADAESTVTDFLAFVDESTLSQNGTTAETGPVELETLQLSVRLGGVGASATVEFRVGDRREMIRTVASGGQADYAGSVLTGDRLLALGTLTTGPQPPTAPLKASIFVLVTCVSALSGGASCPATVSLRYRWMPETATPPAPIAATSASSSKGLGTGAIAGIAAACAIVCMGVAGGLGVLVQTKLAKKEDAAHANGAASRRAQYEAGAATAVGGTAMTSGAAGGFPIATPRESHHTSIALHGGTDDSDAVGGAAAPSAEGDTDDGGFHDIAQGGRTQHLE